MTLGPGTCGHVDTRWPHCQAETWGQTGLGAGLAERMQCWARTAEGDQVGQRSSRRRHGIITTLRLASPAAVTAGEGSAVSRCRCHSEGTVSACCYSLPIGASKATDSCGTRVERDGEAMRSGFGGSHRWASGQSDPVSFSCCFHTISCQGGVSQPLLPAMNNSEVSSMGAQPLARGVVGAALAEKTPLAPRLEPTNWEHLVSPAASVFPSLPSPSRLRESSLHPVYPEKLMLQTSS